MSDPPVILESTGLPVTMFLWGQRTRRTGINVDVYLDMRSPTGKLYRVDRTSGLERAHLEDGYVAECVFDSFGTWYLTWHGLTDDDKPAETRVEVVCLDTTETVC